MDAIMNEGIGRWIWTALIADLRAFGSKMK